MKQLNAADSIVGEINNEGPSKIERLQSELATFHYNKDYEL